ncbi:Translation elongation factor EF1B/ribosomal protein S6 [Acididesulfobacillus acetoxydans]|uniref:Translation elongation factor EF1B/ribosomal protein S6 n=1 Tax=Acididesulfobacillus acetoxydans TaxID=1561005 RepID=A0A8S0WG42_9FIRM|nr:hypothetical protein [Acididesulfobacillus acetoxydans]CAA7601572.1 Translation elongation factor EF1B/ribosomal protein S6 [Acididesulfobacillus acetoxydans]CEJ07059.1 Hypothetical protein DEACI_1515 [Acididesulfobacillus acetoxydans]
MKNKERFQKIALVVLLAFGLLYSYTNYVVWPEWQHIQELGRQVKARQTEYQRLLELKTRQAAVEQALTAAEAKVRGESSKVPALLDEPRLTVDIYSLAKRDGLSPESLRFYTVQHKGNVQEVKLDFVGSGQTAAVLGFIEDIRQSRDLLAIRGVNLTVDKGLMKIGLTLTAYASGGGTAIRAPFMNAPPGISSVVKMFAP